MSDDKKLIEQTLGGEYGIRPKDDEWAEDEYGKTVARLGRWQVLHEDDDRGLYEEDEGELTAQVVGAPEYNNVRISLSFLPDGQDEGGVEVTPFEDIEPVS